MQLSRRSKGGQGGCPVAFLSRGTVSLIVEPKTLFWLGDSIQKWPGTANRHALRVGYSNRTRQEVRHGRFNLRADSGEEVEGQAAHAAACEVWLSGNCSQTCTSFGTRRSVTSPPPAALVSTALS